jgi:hypothetical protein
MKEAVKMAQALLKAEGSTKESVVRYLMRKMGIKFKDAVRIVGELI